MNAETDTRRAGARRASPDVVARALVARVTRGEVVTAVSIPVVSVLVALVVGAVVLSLQGLPVLEAYAQVAVGAFGSLRALESTATAATPLILIALGVAFAYRANLITIGAEGQFLVGAVGAVAVVTAPGVAAALPGQLRLLLGVLIGAACGALWSALTGWLNVRFGASVVITSLLLNYVAQALTVWTARVGAVDPGAFTPQTRPVGDAALMSIPGTRLHIGFVLALVAAGVLWVVLTRGRMGLRVDVMGAGRGVLAANETSVARYTVVVLALSGALAGFAGFVEVAGVTSRITGAFSGAVGFTAIMVALLGRLHPAGVVLAGVLMSGLSVGFAAAGRSLRIPTTTAEIIQAVIILVFLIGTTRSRRSGRAE